MSRRNVDNIVIYSEMELARVLTQNRGRLYKSAKELEISVTRLKQYLVKYPSLADIVYDRKEEILEDVEEILLNISTNEELGAKDRLAAISKLLQRYGRDEYKTTSSLVLQTDRFSEREDVPLHKLLSNPENPYQLNSGEDE